MIAKRLRKREIFITTPPSSHRKSGLQITILNSWYNKAKIPSVYLEGIITLLYKKGDPRDIKNYRPISLLNSDYKIYTRILSNRLYRVLENIRSSNQHAIIKGRSIVVNIMEAKLLTEYCDHNEINGLMVFLDQEKAYDRIEHPIIWQMLNKMGIDKHFIKVIKSL